MDLTPAWTLAIGGDDVTEILRPHLVSLRLVSTTDRTTDTLEIAMTGDAVAAPPTGRELRVAIGYRESPPPVDMGAYWHTATEIELVPPRLLIRATGADLRPGSAIKTPRTQAWHDTTLGAVVSAIAARHDLTPHVAAELASERIAHIDQTGESDLHLLRRMAARYDAVAKAVGSELVFAAAAAATSAGGAPMPSLTLTPASGTVISARVDYADRPAVAAVRAAYRDLGDARTAHVTAGHGTPVHDLPDPYPDRARAQAAAESTLAQHTRSTARLEATLTGLPTLSAGSPIETAGWTRAANGHWIVSRATHTVTPSGYTSTITAQTR